MAALCYSLIESAKMAGGEPRAHLGDATRRAICLPVAVTLAALSVMFALPRLHARRRDRAIEE
jgi:hypothetical protein